MMQFKKIEEQLNDDWYNAQEDVDIDTLINSIHPLDKKRRKRLFFWLSLGAIAIAALSTGLFLEDNADSDTLAIQVPLVSNVKYNGNIDEGKTLSSVTSLKVKETKTSIDKTNAKYKVKTKPTNPKQTQLNTNNHPVYTQNYVSKVKTVVNDKPNNMENQTTQKFSTSDYKEDALEIKNQGVSSFFRKEKLKFNVFPINKLSNALKLNTETKMKWLVTARPVDCPSFRRQKWSLALGAEVGVFNPYKQLELLDSQQSDMYDIRNKDERSLEGLQGSIYAQIKSSKIPLYFKIGAMYSRFTEQLNLNTTTIEQDTTIGILSITQSQNGDTLTVIYGQIISEVVIEKKSLSHHYFNLVDIPVGVGYKFPFGKKMYLGLEAGVNFNILAKAQGKILENSSEVGDVNQLSSFQKKVGLNYYGSAILGYNMKDKHAIYLNAKFILNNNDYSSSTNYIGQKYSFVGLNVGYVYSF